VRAESANSTSANSNVITVTTIVAPPTFASVAQVVEVVCEDTNATFNVEGLLGGSTSTLYYTINGGAEQSVTGVVANGSGSATFNVALPFSANGLVLTITSVERTDVLPTASLPVTENNTAILSVTQSDTYYEDVDGDGFGNPLVTVASCQAVFGYVTNNLDCNDLLSTTYPGATEICYDGLDNDCDGTVDNGCAPLVSEVQSSQCGQTLASIDSSVYANLVSGVQGYRFKVTNMVTNEVQTIDRFLRVFRITQLPNYAFNTEYQVEVAVRKFNIWQPTFGAPCTVKTPATTTQLTSPVNNLSALTDILYANLVPFATGYQFKITNASNAADTQTINRNLREFRMSLLTGITYNNATYNVQVAVRNTDGITYLPYGPICTVITPAFPSTFLQSSQCSDYEVPNYATPLYAEPFTGAQGYRFKLENSGLGYAQEVDRYLRTVRLSDFTGLTAGATYTVKVALKINGVWGSYTGKSCSVIVPGGITRTEEVAEITKGNFAAVAYPNPFANTFAIQVQTTSTAVIQMKVYDMLGRLVEQRETAADEKEVTIFGERYPSGVYSVIVTQGGITETLRVVKR
jgi:hypothetical protein